MLSLLEGGNSRLEIFKTNDLRIISGPKTEEVFKEEPHI
jgi:hypothetical protein